jgi:hypothetical protein
MGTLNLETAPTKFTSVRIAALIPTKIGQAAVTLLFRINHHIATPKNNHPNLISP